MSGEVSSGTSGLPEPQEPGWATQPGGGFVGGPPPYGDWNWSQQLDRIERKQDSLITAFGSMQVQLNRILGQELAIGKKENKIMADVKIAQETLDADGDALTQLAADLQSIIAGGNLSDADQTKLTNGINALTALDSLQVTPPAPVDPNAPTS